MFSKLKDLFYFPIASYFKFFAKIRLRRWHPRVIVVTGSNGKTTLLHLLEAQIGEKAYYSHHANSSFGIPFDILDLHRKTLQRSEWIGLFLKAPLQVFAPVRKEKLYIVEADADRPNEGKFISELLQPEVVLWVSTARTHSMNFDALVRQGKFNAVEDAIAYEFGYFIEQCQKFAVLDGDSSLEMKQIDRTKAHVKVLKKKELLKKYEITKQGTTFEIGSERYTIKALLPEEVFLSVAMAKELVDYLGLQFDNSFADFKIPPGRGSLFQGIKDITIIDSCYNNNLSSMKATLTMYKKFPGKVKWAVIGDMLEQGKAEKEEHEKMALLLVDQDFERIVFLGPRVKKYTIPQLKKLLKKDIPMDAFENPKELLDFLLDHLHGGETILFKGIRFMEGVIEHLLKDKSDVAKLPRREKIWDIRRKQWGF